MSESFDILIGWFDPVSLRFCYDDEKQNRPERRKSHTVPVFAHLHDDPGPARLQAERERFEMYRTDIRRRRL